ncbi:MAG: hypothetical protein LBU34_07865 [Planctomycetaceae bacterium]|nr:hypothetical protein [Planctomycetaceae bacterium]
MHISSLAGLEGNQNNQHCTNSLSADADAIMGESPSASDCLPFVGLGNSDP